MRIDEQLLEAFIDGLDLEGRGLVAPAGAEFRRWLRARNLPERLTHFLSRYSPREELWAGAGALFTEGRIMKFNDDFPSALESGLLLLGSAPNGDWIAVDVREWGGATGYISHEHDWEGAPRQFFIGVAPSVGEFVHRQNSEGDESLPDDYWEAKGRQGGRP